MNLSLDMQQILSLARRENASDIHIVAGLPPMFRINGEIILSNKPALTRQDTAELCYSLLNEEQKKVFEQNWQLCCSIFDAKLGRFRVSIYYHGANPEMAIRPVMDHIKTREELRLPAGDRRVHAAVQRPGLADRVPPAAARPPRSTT